MNISNYINQQQPLRVNSNFNENRQSYSKSGYSNISFGSNKSEKMLELVEKSIDNVIGASTFNIRVKAQFAAILKKALPDIMKQENFINSGLDSKVYRISNKYVAKIKNKCSKDDAVKFYHTVSIPNNKFKNLDFYYGEPVAKIGNIEILRNATPKENSIYCGAKFKGNNTIPEEEIERYEKVYLPICSELPQEAFDDLARNLKKMNEIQSEKSSFNKYYMPDCQNANNFIISDGKFKLVDELEKVPYKNPNSIYTMIEPLLIRLGPYNRKEHYVIYKPELTAMREKIYDKCVNAAKKTGLPMDSDAKGTYVDWYLCEILPNKRF